VSRSREAQQGLRNIAEDVGVSLIRLEKTHDDWAGEGVMLTSFTVSTRYKGRGDVLIVARLTDGNQKWVAFQSGETIWEALKSFANRMSNKQLQLKEDKYE